MVEVSIQIQKSESGYTAYSPTISELRIEGQSLDTVVNELKELLREYLDAAKPTPSETTGQSLLHLFDQATGGMDDTDIAPLLSDRADQLSFAEAAAKYVGCLDDGPEDLSTNPKYMEGFGE